MQLMKHAVDAKTLVVLGTGGTIAGRADAQADHVGYIAAQIGVGQLVESVPLLVDLLGGYRLVTEQVAQIDSKDMSWPVWQLLAQRCAIWLTDPAVQALVITHGTDTLEETAWFLQSVLQPEKPVVLTCAMRPATALVPDGPQNLLDALTVALDARAGGVLAVCAGVVHDALRVQKIHSYRLDAFDSGPDGPCGHVEQGWVRWAGKSDTAGHGHVKAGLRAVTNVSEPPWVEIVMNHQGADGRQVDALVRAGVKGLVAAGTGNGSLHADLEAALLRAQAAGVRVVRASRCCQGRVLPSPGDALPESNGLSPVKARVSLMLSLLASDGPADAG